MILETIHANFHFAVCQLVFTEEERSQARLFTQGLSPVGSGVLLARFVLHGELFVSDREAERNEKNTKKALFSAKDYEPFKEDEVLLKVFNGLKTLKKQFREGTLHGLPAQSAEQPPVPPAPSTSTPPASPAAAGDAELPADEEAALTARSILKKLAEFADCPEDAVEKALLSDGKSFDLDSLSGENFVMDRLEMLRQRRQRERREKWQDSVNKAANVVFSAEYAPGSSAANPPEFINAVRLLHEGKHYSNFAFAEFCLQQAGEASEQQQKRLEAVKSVVAPKQALKVLESFIEVVKLSKVDKSIKSSVKNRAALIRAGLEEATSVRSIVELQNFLEKYESLLPSCSEVLSTFKELLSALRPESTPESSARDDLHLARSAVQLLAAMGEKAFVELIAVLECDCEDRLGQVARSDALLKYAPELQAASKLSNLVAQKLADAEDSGNLSAETFDGLLQVIGVFDEDLQKSLSGLSTLAFGLSLTQASDSVTDDLSFFLVGAGLVQAHLAGGFDRLRPDIALLPTTATSTKSSRQRAAEAREGSDAADRCADRIAELLDMGSTETAVDPKNSAPGELRVGLKSSSNKFPCAFSIPEAFQKDFDRKELAQGGRSPSDDLDEAKLLIENAKKALATLCRSVQTDATRGSADVLHDLMRIREGAQQWLLAYQQIDRVRRSEGNAPAATDDLVWSGLQLLSSHTTKSIWLQAQSGIAIGQAAVAALTIQDFQRCMYALRLPEGNPSSDSISAKSLLELLQKWEPTTVRRHSEFAVPLEDVKRRFEEEHDVFVPRRPSSQPATNFTESYQSLRSNTSFSPAVGQNGYTHQDQDNFGGAVGQQRSSFAKNNPNAGIGKNSSSSSSKGSQRRIANGLKPRDPSRMQQGNSAHRAAGIAPVATGSNGAMQTVPDIFSPQGSAMGSESQDLSLEQRARAKKEMQKSNISARLDADSVEKLLKEAAQKDLGKIYEEMNPADLVDGQVMKIPKEYRDEFMGVSERERSWTFSRLVRSSALGGMVSEALAQLRGQVNSSTKSIRPVEIVVLVDNSGSMTQIRSQVMETLVFMLEVLRKLELRFAVAAIGDPNTCRLLKELDEPFDTRVGDMVISGLTFNESSKIGSCAHTVAERVFGGRQTQTDAEQRVIILITDGLSNDISHAEIPRLRADFNLKFAVLHATPTTQARDLDAFRALEMLSNRLYFPAPQDDIIGNNKTGLLEASLRCLTELFAILTGSAGSAAETNPIQRDTHHPEAMMESMLNSDVLHHIRCEPLTLEESLEAARTQKNLFMFNSKKRDLPADMHTSAMQADTDTILNAALEFRRRELEETQRNLSSCVESARGDLRKLRQSLAGGVDDLADVLADVVLPYNRYTRKRPSMRGAQFHTPGLIKAIVTKFEYKKIFSAKTAGGKRCYDICLVLDVSQSMHGHLLDCAVQSLLLLGFALDEIGIDSFSVVTFGKTVRIVKSPDEPWGAETVLALLAQVSLSSSNTATEDAEAVRTASSLLSANARNEKLMLVLTDGRSSNPKKLREEIGNAQDAGIRCVSLSIGVDDFAVEDCYPEAVMAAIPGSLGQGLRHLFVTDAGDAEKMESLENDVGRDQGGVESILGGHRWADLQEKLKLERDAKLVQGNSPDEVAVALSFVIDCTGSMSAHLPSIKHQLIAMLEGETSIKQRIKDEYGWDIDIYVSVNAFHDDTVGLFSAQVGDGELTYFTQDTAKIVKALENGREFKAYGGHDVAEDSARALRMAAEISDWEKNFAVAKFMILITDAPCHGADFSSPSSSQQAFWDDRADASAQSRRDIQAAFDLNLRNDVVTVLGDCNAEATKQMFTKMQELQELQKQSAESRLAAQVQTGGGSSLPRRTWLSKVAMSDPKTVPRLHFVFVLDQSGSMCGAPWQELSNCVENFKQRRISNQKLDDHVSVIQFDNSASLILEAESVTALRLGPQSSGGTAFSPAMQAAQQVIQNNSQAGTPCVVMMTDGQAGDAAQASLTLAQIARKFGPTSGFEAHIVGFGSGADYRTLQLIASGASGRGQIHQANIGDLDQTFTQISNRTEASAELYKEVGQIISSQIKTQLAEDFL